ncbi:MAG: hypothetical protein E6K56_11540 [Ignavibacteria bacterium]|nr:MAG: hypothetical protein E6K56_11540 [Ignavibacteria bacterium]
MLASITHLLGQDHSSLVNFSHLNHLTERIDFLGDSVDILHVYSNYPDYRWIDAAESGPEGIACIDDAGRAAVLYLRHYELTGREESRTRALSLLRFVVKMETPDGKFYNFILKDHSINTTGKTSFKSFGWWAARALWSMGTGYRVLRTRDTAFAAVLGDGIRRALPNVGSLLENYRKYETTKKLRAPTWLLYGSGADATSELLLGLTEYHAASRDPRVGTLILILSSGLTSMQEGNMRTFPYSLHRSWQTYWHMWGNSQTQALAQAGKSLPVRKMVESAKQEADCFYSRLLIEGFMKEMDVTDPSKKIEYEQIAYGVRPMAVGLLRLYEATKDSIYLKMAGLAASWLFGNNVLHQAMYDSSTGRCFDGIRDSATVNRNSGAESTIEALQTLVEIERYPLAKHYLGFRKTRQRRTERFLYAAFRNSGGESLTLAIDLKKSGLLLLEQAESVEFQKVQDRD